LWRTNEVATTQAFVHLYVVRVFTASNSLVVGGRFSTVSMAGAVRAEVVVAC